LAFKLSIAEPTTIELAVAETAEKTRSAVINEVVRVMLIVASKNPLLLLEHAIVARLMMY
jgi:hypothetical protein